MADRSAATKPTFFTTPSGFRAWLEKRHDKDGELWVGFHKTGSGRQSITWPEAVAEALCFGWIDGVRRTIDGTSYSIRFTPRRPHSTWSAINIEKVGELTRLGRMAPPGLKAFQGRDQKKSGVYSYEQRKSIRLDDAYAARLRANQKAWGFFQMMPPSYRAPAIWWVMSAKREETRLSRLDRLIEDSEKGHRIGPLRRATKKE